MISLNIEGDNHLKKVIPFLISEEPEIICLQEIFKKDTVLIEDSLNMRSYFFPMGIMVEPNYSKKYFRELWGISFFTKLETKNVNWDIYLGQKNDLPIYLGGGGACNRILVWGKFIKDNQEFTIATTHFTWSSKGNTTILQRSSYKKMSRILDKVGDCVLCGDFNAPRGGIIYTKLANRFQDNIPIDIKTTIDEELHRKKGLQIVVDGLFTAQTYQVQEVNVIGGVSDHKAIVGKIIKII